ncbi:response regulator [Agaribacter flavus]|uniref:Response regulator n=1 Tax=Agaribacter flavus TaxID=1902781 RepID=A0ABV7FN24_9ALTE
MSAIRPIEILLVEDNPGDVMLTEEAFSAAKISNTLNVVRDGEEALAYLNKEAGFEDVVLPDLILLDLNLPKIDGREVLDKIKTSEKLKRIPVVVLTSSEAEQDVVKTYDLHANSYVVKPLDLDQFINVVSVVENFWFSVVTLPNTQS